MFKSLLVISITSFVIGLGFQIMICGLYITTIIEAYDPALVLLLALYLVSETLVIGGVLYFVVAAPLLFLLLGKLHMTEPGFYPLAAILLCAVLAASKGFYTEMMDWRLFALFVPAAFFFGGMWWNRIELDRRVKLAA
ncbi:MAG: hypothetical protein M0Z65_11795 [Firmicutes bacterium]|uniref:Uncharacterized protein n=1 Tax=Melghirimyces thermohalophilus TaxID=1236220 RepID=A0A1G6LCZ4_9BACL|nr:hypothetical protein [Melghirimyces thermohalophilus]MDA8353836.1 hypothetical protein [Bacillota bacterium]SDC41074.1 hypothetical protein SAMN04488112_107171 [Melghirimyces thermohalophilus]